MAGHRGEEPHWSVSPLKVGLRAVNEAGEESDDEDNVLEMPDGITGEIGERIRVERGLSLDKKVSGSSSSSAKGGG